MLTPRDICILQSVGKGQKFVIVAADQVGYGLGSGRRYPPGKHRPDGADEGGWMVYWTSFLVRVETPFLGRLATPEHVYAVGNRSRGRRG